MNKKNTLCNKTPDKDRILRQLLLDPTIGIQKMAKKLKTYRQRIWRKKKKMEEENRIWGYTAVVDESKFGHVTYLVLMKMKPMSEQTAELIIKRQKKGAAEKQNVRLINVLYVNGEYDWIVMFSAPDHSTARRYYDSLRISYEEHLLEKPTIVDVNFPLIREGKRNPELSKLKGFVPIK